VAVARILADLEMDAEAIMAALLHDTVEDTHLTLGEPAGGRRRVTCLDHVVVTCR
jgi:hypothetical protein